MYRLFLTIIIMAAFQGFLSAQTPPPDFETAKTLLSRGNTAEAVRMLELLVSAEPENAQKTYYLAKAYSWSSEWEKSIAMYTRAIALDPKKGEVYYQSRFGIAQVTGWKKKYSESVFLYSSLINEAGKQARKEFIRDIYLGMGDTSSWNNDYDFALTSYRHAHETDPSSAEPFLRISKIYFWMRQYQKSKEYAKKTLELDPANADAKNRIKDIDLIKQYVIKAASTTTLHSAKNPKGDPIRTEEAVLDFAYQPDDDTSLHLFTDVIIQNYIETRTPADDSETNYDCQFGAGASRKFFNILYLGIDTRYTWNAVIFPDFSTEINTGYKISRNFDLVAMYRITYDRIDSFQSDKRPLSHLFAPGAVFYFSPSFYVKGQSYIDTNFRDYFLSGLVNVTLHTSQSDKLDLYASYGKGQNTLVFAGATNTNIDVATTGIAGSYSHYFNSSFGMSGGLSWTKTKSDTSFGFNIASEFRL